MGSLIYRLMLNALICIAQLSSQQSVGELTCYDEYSAYGEWCYRLYADLKANYYEARKICNEEGAELASIHDANANTYIRKLDKEGVLIGLKYSPEKNKYEWSDSTPLDYNNIAVSSMQKEREYLGYCTKNVKGQWVNTQCDTDVSRFVCRKKAIRIPSSDYETCPNISAVYRIPGLLFSPGYPEHYDLDIDSAAEGCFYRLLAKNNQYITIIFEEMELDESGIINIYQGWTANEDYFVVSVDQSYEDAAVTVEYNRALIHIADSITGKWKISWAAKDVESEHRFDVCPDPRIFFSQPGEVTSPGYPEDFEYSGDISAQGCDYRFAAVDGGNLFFIFDEVRFGNNKGTIELFSDWELAESIASVASGDEGTRILIESDRAVMRVYDASDGAYKVRWFAIEGCKEEWTYFEESCYFFNITPSSHADAQQFCSDEDSNLVSITSPEEQEFLNEFVPNGQEYHIGLVKVLGQWQWLDESEVSYLNWYPGQPDGTCGPDGSCMASANYQRLGFWDDRYDVYAAYRRLPFVCKHALAIEE